jgi:hypothetical protein
MARQPVIKKPTVPEDTCPYIDMVQELIDKMAESDDTAYRNDQAVLARALLEYIRESNLRLRNSSKFWHSKYRP